MRKFARILLLVTLALLPAPPPFGVTPARAQVKRHALKGLASWYGRPHHGRRTASGTRFNMFALTAAHKTLPFGTRVRVTALGTGRTVELVIDDRGPYVGQRILDLSRAAAMALGTLRSGVAEVWLEILPRRARGAVAAPIEPEVSAEARAARKLGPRTDAEQGCIAAGGPTPAELRVER